MDDDGRSLTRRISYTPGDDMEYQNEAIGEDVVQDLGNVFEDMFDDSTDDDRMIPHAYGDGGPREALERSQTVERFHEIPGESSGSFGPVRGWRDRVNERQKTRTDVSAQNSKRESKLGRHFKKRESRNPDPRDVFFAEMEFLQEVEQFEPVVPFSPDSCFKRVFCEKCQRHHDAFQVETQTQMNVENDQTRLGEGQFMKSDGTIVIEHDVGLRNLLNPHKITNFPVSLHEITSQRLTEMIFEDGSTEVVDDCWNHETSRHIKSPWKGRTVFYLRGDGSRGPGKEYQWQKLEESKQDMFQVAMDKEWQSFIDLDAVRVVKKDEAQKIPSSRILPTRFVLTNKDPTGETLICKARLVCGGHRDPDISLLRTDAPTTDALGVHLILVLAASFRCRIQSGDVSTAFLSGVFDSRNLYMRPPREGLKGVQTGELLELKKGVYGLCNAPRLWWRKLRETLLSLGFVEMRLLPCVFLMWTCDENAKPVSLMGILAVHVDDVIIAGNELFENILTRLKQSLTFGKWFTGQFEYTGRTVRQAEDFSIYISQKNYSNKVPYVPVSSEQLKCPDEPVDEVTRAALRKTAGAGCWLAKTSRPDLSFEVSLIQQSLNAATMETVKIANQMVRRARQISYELKIPGIDLSSPSILEISDASPGKMPRSGSQGGFCIFVTTPAVCEAQSPVGIVSWLSHRLKRVARSSLATEGMALCESVEHGEYVRACLAEMLDPNFNFRKWEDAASWISLVTGTDCKSVYDNVTAERGLSKDRMFALDLAQLKETFEGQWKEDARGDRNACLKWIPGPRNVSDGFTKYVAVQDVMISVMRSGMYCVADDVRLLANIASAKCDLKEKKTKN